jgi:prepilin-type N-terminal cleavage/methylation domain-containing protein
MSGRLEFMQHERVAEQRGFTLIEVLIAIVILGVLAGIVVFAVGGTASNSKRQACKTEAREFVNGVQAYAANHRGTAVAGAPNTQTMATHLYGDGVLSKSQLAYLSSAQGGTTNPGGWLYTNGTADDSGCGLLS